MLTDALGRPLRFVVTAGQVNDCTQADRLLEGVETAHVIADKGNFPVLRCTNLGEAYGAAPVIRAR
jgi:IS5 family transposase